eukprot:scaffold11484_cov125-Isochrysis_galbana.AAC.3
MATVLLHHSCIGPLLAQLLPRTAWAQPFCIIPALAALLLAQRETTSLGTAPSAHLQNEVCAVGNTSASSTRGVLTGLDAIQGWSTWAADGVSPCTAPRPFILSHPG